MTEDEERLKNLENTVRGFKLVTNGTDQVLGGFDELKSKTSFADRLTHLEKLHENFRIVGGNNVTVEGSMATGYAICATCPDTGGGTGGISGGGGGGPPQPTGACCINGTCSITTEEACNNAGGDYQGDNTTCDPNPCTVPTGACCVGDVCSIETRQHCAELGGDYQGDNTTCEPDTCPTEPHGACCQEDGDCVVLPVSECDGHYNGDNTTCDFDICCFCNFEAFDGSGRAFLRYHRDIIGTIDNEASNSCSPPNDFTLSAVADCSATYEAHFLPRGTFGFCPVIVDNDTSSSSYTTTVNHAVVDSCSRSDIECFCPSIAPHNECIANPFFEETNCGCGPPASPSVVTTATTRTTTYTFSQDCSISCVSCPGCTLHCTVSGSYVVTETLSEECHPVDF